MERQRLNHTDQEAETENRWTKVRRRYGDREPSLEASAIKHRNDCPTLTKNLSELAWGYPCALRRRTAPLWNSCVPSSRRRATLADMEARLLGCAETPMAIAHLTEIN